MTGFEGIGDFDSDDPWQRYIAHQAAKGRYPSMTEDEIDAAIVEVRDITDNGERLTVEELIQMQDMWYDDRKNLQELAVFLDGIGLPVEDADGVAYFLEKPWKWEKEYLIMRDNPDWNNYSDDALDELRSQIIEEQED